MLLTEREIRNIIEEEIITILIEEGFLQDLGKKAGKAMLPLAMAAGLSGMAGTAQASPSLQSAETPIAQVALSPTSQKISKELKKLGQNLSPDDVNELGQLVDKLDSSCCHRFRWAHSRCMLLSYFETRIAGTLDTES